MHVSWSGVCSITDSVSWQMANKYEDIEILTYKKKKIRSIEIISSFIVK